MCPSDRSQPSEVLRKFVRGFPDSLGRRVQRRKLGFQDLENAERTEVSKNESSIESIALDRLKKIVLSFRRRHKTRHTIHQKARKSPQKCTGIDPNAKGGGRGGFDLNMYICSTLNCKKKKHSVIKPCATPHTFMSQKTKKKKTRKNYRRTSTKHQEY